MKIQITDEEKLFSNHTSDEGIGFRMYKKLSKHKFEQLNTDLMQNR